MWNTDKREYRMIKKVDRKIKLFILPHVAEVSVFRGFCIFITTQFNLLFKSSFSEDFFYAL